MGRVLGLLFLLCGFLNVYLFETIEIENQLDMLSSQIYWSTSILCFGISIICFLFNSKKERK